MFDQLVIGEVGERANLDVEWGATLGGVVHVSWLRLEKW